MPRAREQHTVNLLAVAGEEIVCRVVARWIPVGIDESLPAGMVHSATMTATGKHQAALGNLGEMRFRIHAAPDCDRHVDRCIEVAREVVVEQRGWRIGPAGPLRVHRGLVFCELVIREPVGTLALAAGLAHEGVALACIGALRDVVDHHAGAGAPGLRTEGNAGCVKIDTAVFSLILAVPVTVLAPRNRGDTDTAFHDPVGTFVCHCVTGHLVAGDSGSRPEQERECKRLSDHILILLSQLTRDRSRRVVRRRSSVPGRT